MDRYYNDGIDLGRDGVWHDQSQGTVRVNLLTNQGAQVTYCMPILFPGVDSLFALVKKEYPCHDSRIGRSYSGIAIVKKATFGREPTEL